MIILRASTPGDESSPRMKTWPASKFGQHHHPWKLIIIARMIITMGMMTKDDDEKKSDELCG